METCASGPSVSTDPGIDLLRPTLELLYELAKHEYLQDVPLDDRRRHCIRLKADLEIIANAEVFTGMQYLNPLQVAVGTSLLRTVEDHFTLLDVTHEVDYPRLNHIVSCMAELTAQPSLEWVASVLRVWQPDKSDKKINRRLSTDVQNLSAAVTTNSAMALPSEWPKAKKLFDAMLASHSVLKEEWLTKCNCDTCDHDSALLSFGHLESRAGTEVSYQLAACFTENAAEWSWRTINNQMVESMERTSATTGSQRAAPRQKNVSFADFESLSLETLPAADICGLLRSRSTGTFQLGEMRVQGLMQDPYAELEPCSFEEWTGTESDERQGDNSSRKRTAHTAFELDTLQHRLVTALVLSYAYLHLVGTALWPYERTDSALWYFKEPGVQYTHTQPFISLLPYVHEKGPNDVLARSMNRVVPSLPSLGKTLLALVSGQSSSWDHFSDRCMALNKQFPGTLALAFSDCLYLDELKKDVGTLDAKKRFKRLFLEKVVLRLQFVVEVGFELGFQDVFDVPSLLHGKLNQPTTRPVKSPRSLRKKSRNGLLSNISTPVPTILTPQEQAKAHKSDVWLRRSRECVRCYLDVASAATKSIKIAVIDTGLFLTASDQNLYGDRVSECRSWCISRAFSTNSQGSYVFRCDEDENGHGTHITTSLLDLTADCECEIYVARVFQNGQSSGSWQAQLDLPRQVARAIEHAALKWRVDVISLSFGFERFNKQVSDAITIARNENVLIFAAASNDGMNTGRAWPASDSRVHCVHATDGQGVWWNGNPSTKPDAPNFAFPGVEMKSKWLPQQGLVQKVRKSGTSFATPIAAGIAAIMLDLMARWEEPYVRWRTKFGSSVAKARGQYCEGLQQLRTVDGMNRVLRLMSDPDAPHSYRYVVPWRLFEKYTGEDRHLLVKEILRCLEMRSD